MFDVGETLFRPNQTTQQASIVGAWKGRNHEVFHVRGADHSPNTKPKHLPVFVAPPEVLEDRGDVEAVRQLFVEPAHKGAP